MNRIIVDTEDLGEEIKEFIEGFWKVLLENQSEYPTEELGWGLSVERVTQKGRGVCLKVSKGTENQTDAFYLDRMSFATLEQYAERTGFNHKSCL